MRIAENHRSFDSIAAEYDELWSKTDAGYWQRQAVWDAIQPLFRPGDHVLDIGCGTGVDALWLSACGIDVLALDASAEMVQVARSKGAHAEHLSAEELDGLKGTYDGAISNFGVLNCVPDLRVVGTQLARLVKRRGYVALCLMGRFCVWETAHYLACGKLRTATRRWSSQSISTSLGVDVRYPSIKELAQALAPEFRLRNWKGVGIFVPPSYIHGLSRSRMSRLAVMDRRIGSIRLLRALSDHRLLIMERL